MGEGGLSADQTKDKNRKSAMLWTGFNQQGTSVNIETIITFAL